jgi:hypothetical protein
VVEHGGHEHDQGAAEQCAVATWLPRHHVAPPLTKVATQGATQGRFGGKPRGLQGSTIDSRI